MMNQLTRFFGDLSEKPWRFNPHLRHCGQYTKVLEHLKDQCLKPRKQITAHVYRVYPLVNVYITMERPTIFNGKIHYNLPFSIAMLVITRGYLVLQHSISESKPSQIR
jgi:dUTPase